MKHLAAREKQTTGTQDIDEIQIKYLTQCFSRRPNNPKSV